MEGVPAASPPRARRTSTTPSWRSTASNRSPPLVQRVVAVSEQNRAAPMVSTIDAAAGSATTPYDSETNSPSRSAAGLTVLRDSHDALLAERKKRAGSELDDTPTKASSKKTRSASGWFGSYRKPSSKRAPVPVWDEIETPQTAESPKPANDTTILVQAPTPESVFTTNVVASPDETPDPGLDVIPRRSTTNPPMSNSMSQSDVLPQASPSRWRLGRKTVSAKPSVNTLASPPPPAAAIETAEIPALPPVEPARIDGTPGASTSTTTTDTGPSTPKSIPIPIPNRDRAGSVGNGSFSSSWFSRNKPQAAPPISPSPQPETVAQPQPQPIPATENVPNTAELVSRALVDTKPKKKRPAPLSPIPSSVDSHVPTLVSPSRARSPDIEVPPPSPPPALISAWDTIRPRLALPLLGRRKIPVEEFITPFDDNSTVGDTSTIAPDTPATVSLQLGPTVSEPPAEDLQEQGQTTVTTTTTTTASTSWFYFWSSNPTEARAESSTSTEETAPEPQAVVASVEVTKTTVSNSEPDASSQRGSVETNSATVQTASAPPTSASWFWPWLSDSSTPMPEDVEDHTKTEAELVKEAALARSVEPTNEVLPTVEEPSSPLLTTAGAQASWLSFFSSPAPSSIVAKTRAIKDKKPETEEEEMVLDASELPQAPVAVVTTAAPSRSNSRPSSRPQTAKNPAVSKLPATEPPKPNPNPPITDSTSVKNMITSVVKSGANSRSSSPGRNPKSPKPPGTPVPKQPNLILPTFRDTFETLPRSQPPPKRPAGSFLMSKVAAVTGYVLGVDVERIGPPGPHEPIGPTLPRLWSVMEEPTAKGKGKRKAVEQGPSRGCKRAVVIGVHGWFPGGLIKSVFGAPTGTSAKFANMMAAAVETHLTEQGVKLEKLTNIALEGEGTISTRVEVLYQNLCSNKEWLDDIHKADVIFIATHSQGSVASTELLHRLFEHGHVNTSTMPAASFISGGSPSAGPSSVPPVLHTSKVQKICLLAICGIHMGPFQYLSGSVVGTYLQTFETSAATELFEFQDSDNQVAKRYVNALDSILQKNVKCVYVSSMNDQVVPIYSAIFSAANHPSILRALFIDGEVYSASDFLSNLLVLLFRLRNADLTDHGLLLHLSDATAGSLAGLGHSTPYEDANAYKLAVRFLFETTDTIGPQPALNVEHYKPVSSKNDYDIPWLLRELIAHSQETGYLADEWHELADSFDSWTPKTAILREMKRKLQPIQRLKKKSKL